MTRFQFPLLKIDSQFGEGAAASASQEVSDEERPRGESKRRETPKYTITQANPLRGCLAESTKRLDTVC